MSPRFGCFSPGTASLSLGLEAGSALATFTGGELFALFVELNVGRNTKEPQETRGPVQQGNGTYTFDTLKI